MKKIEFNNGFIVAIALFLEHKFDISPIFDLRLYGASDHLFDLDIPDEIPTNLKKRIRQWQKRCLSLRLEHCISSEIPNQLFKEGENILKAIDKQLFNRKVTIHLR